MLMLILRFYEASSNQSIPCIAASLDYAQTKTHTNILFRFKDFNNFASQLLVIFATYFGDIEHLHSRACHHGFFSKLFKLIF